MVDHSMMKLGKKPARHDKRTLQLASYLATHLPTPPAAVAWSSKVHHWPMYLNDSLGDCTCAAAGHMIQAWTADGQNKEFDVSDQDVLKMYEMVGGYRPGQPDTDQGAVELDVLKYWRKLGCARHTISAFMAVSPQSTTLVKDGIYLFGGLYVGIALPVSAQNQQVWDVPPGGIIGDGFPGSWGGHAVPIIDYDLRGLTCVTWGSLKRMTWAFLKLYCDEAYAILSPDFLLAGKAPNGFNAAQLQADLAAL
jgi:hypothetical protein